MMDISLWLVLGATLIQYMLGAFWYSVPFGKAWMQIMGMENMSEEEKKTMQKAMGPFYGVEFVITLISTAVLAYAIAFYNSVYNPLDFIARLEFALYVSFFMLVGFIFPTQISSVIWGSTKRRFWGKQIMIMVGMKCVGLILASIILSV